MQRSRLWMFKGLAGILSKTSCWNRKPETNTGSVSSLRGSSGQRIKQCRAPKEQRSAWSAEKLFASLSLVGHGGVVAHPPPKHKDSQTRRIIHFSYLHTSDVLWPQGTAWIPSQFQFGIQFCSQGKYIYCCCYQWGARWFCKSLLNHITKISPQSASFAV